MFTEKFSLPHGLGVGNFFIYKPIHGSLPQDVEGLT